MDVALVVVEEPKLFFGEGVGFEGDFQFMSGFNVWFDIDEFAFVNCSDQVERSVRPLLFSIV